MLDLTWIKGKQLIEHAGEDSDRITTIDHIGIDDAMKFIQRVNKKDHLHVAAKTPSFSRYSRIGLTITPVYLNLRGSNTAKRRRVHPFGLIQYLTASLLIGGNTFSESGTVIECAKAKELDVFYGSLCLYAKELDNLRAVLPMDERDKLNLSKVLSGELKAIFPECSMAADAMQFEKMRLACVEKYIQRDFGDAADTYAKFWAMMYYRTFVGCFDRYMPDLLALAIG